MKTKKWLLLCILITVFTVTMIMFFSGTIFANADMRGDILVTFKNKGIEITPTKIDNGYSMEYVPDMIISISGSISSDPNARSESTIRQGEKILNSINKAGVYEISVIVYPSSGGSFIVESFEFEVFPKEIKDIKFDLQSVNITYSDELAPKLLIDEVEEKNSIISYTYYNYDDNSLTTEIQPPQNVGNYWIVAEISGDYYCGRAVSAFSISPNNASIDLQYQNPEITYVREDTGDNGYKITELLGATIENTNNIEKHELKTYIETDEGYVEQQYILKPNTYNYMLFFANGENYSAEPIYGTIELKKADTELVFEKGIKIPYSNDLDAIDVAKSFFNKDGGYTVFSLETKGKVSEISENQISIRFFDKDGNPLEQPPQNVGEYEIVVEFEGNDYYNPTSSQSIPFEIERRDISNEIIVYAEQNFGYGSDYNVENYFIIPDKYSVIPIYKYQEIDSENQILSEKPVAPGSYMAILSIDEECYFGTKKFVFTISKLAIPESAIKVDNLEYVYGENLNIQVNVDSEYNVKSDEISLSFLSLGGEQFDGTPVSAGKYTVKIHVENTIYQTDVTRELTISKKDLTISAKDREVTYGNPLFSLDENKGYREEDFVIEGLVNSTDVASVLASITVFVGDEGYTTNNMNMVVGTYDMRLSGTHLNYNIIDGGCGKLTVAKRVLTIRTSSVKQYVGYSFPPTITVENSVYNDLAENMVYLFEVYYSLENGELLNTQPSLTGTYQINAKVKSENIDCLELKNYTLNFIGSTLTLLNNQKTDSENLFILEGKFDTNTELNVKTITANEAVEKAIKTVDKKYDVAKLYFIQYTFNTVDDSRFVLKLNRKGIDVENAKIMIGYNTDSFEEVDYTVQGDYIVIRLDNMASYYAICTPHKLPVLWIIVIAVAVVLVLGGVGVFLWIYFTGANVKARKNEATLSSAVTATQGLKTEDEEFDELLETFDQSTVQKHEDPANRISRQIKEAEREQYRLYLRRMRASTDRNALDKMKELGLTSDFDEEKAIDQLIEEDRKKCLKREEEEARIKQEEEKKKQEATSFTINQRKSGTLSGASMPIKPTKKNVDDDIDV